MRIATTAAIAALLLAATAQAEPPCQLQRIGVIPFESHENLVPLIPVAVADRKTHALIDTGGYWSLISERLVAEQRFPTRPADLTFTDAAGKGFSRVARVHGLTLGGAKLDIDFDFLVGGFARDHSLDDWALTIGMNFLNAMDLEVDNAAKTISLFSNNHCKGMGVYWADEAATLEMRPSPDRIADPIVDAELQGEHIRVLFDTGSTMTSMDAKLARRRFGITSSTPGVVPDGQIRVGGGKMVPVFRYTFDELTISGVRFENVPIQIGNFGGDIDVILGMHEMRHLHLYFAFKDELLHITAADAGKEAPAGR